ncbi:Non-classified, family GTnc [Pseudoalteromonas sp. 3J6]|uniref:UDP-2,4-diacetamido-2,4, 6-trideoxy-beta-L-altropyranose hydrolase n=1 Tax=unclassified Pseudoalteromonas TaxID=194690 RepID=UPI0015B80EE8|nr:MULTISPECIES: UDP-2,4-diacetamido-2,4,6-trideoxy-beta-L-altropyranose hydrolase [unclassified Pseudoalteromonas]NWL17010.1 UDP-2,4-diacetamido-2,4,6-trideoxy-beta-L-altropyranose hydrolase [Pseudoalteromonas sp. Scap03]QLE82108.1 UDP-2,4-diacetamido-2,4,6-trideoxy-beta-L-altropyranose hydrolase [Pseudoalteromonas sp. Scap25]QLE90051.1 UDP-2,4-diacetamido-2,4,6-trideoxy-beta-L-altropyranose hydrolase [Pseudoalteromonas sp. Scap06]CAD2225373.1 Non-classified, family GTnc [Pseudoalteromonas sp.|tara:strand:- start:2570 stop:3685 length:1116 start_codon:yes stop_codon:yes gene_type:complete
MVSININKSNTETPTRLLNIAFRVDASLNIGSGHVMRCLTLATAIRKAANVNITFFCRDAAGNSNENIIQSGFELVRMAPPKNTIDLKNYSSWLGTSIDDDCEEFLKLTAGKNYDLIVIDHYAIDNHWHNKVKSITKKIMVIDDLANRIHNCDLLLDQTYQCPTVKYSHLINNHTKLLLGSSFALLRPEFLDFQKASIVKKERTLLIMFGGTDPDNLTLQVLARVIKLKYFERINVILNKTAKNVKSVFNFAQCHKKVFLHISPSNIAEIMSTATIAIGAAGTTSWERCALGLPAVVIVQADNQREIANALQLAEVIRFISIAEIEDKLIKEIEFWQNRLKLSNDVHKNCINICDGKGTVRVTNEVLKVIE